MVTYQRVFYINLNFLSCTELNNETYIKTFKMLKFPGGINNKQENLHMTISKKIKIDLTGKSIGKLRVLRLHGKGGTKCNTEWLCVCACGQQCIKSRSLLTSKTQQEKNCGNCVEGTAVIGKTFKSLKILYVEENKRKKIDSGFYIGECIKCGYQKKISKKMIKYAHKPACKRNLTCPKCLIKSRQGGGLKIGDQNKNLKIVSSLGTKGRGDKKKFYWLVECLFQGPECKKYMEYSSVVFKQNASCGCKYRHDRRTVAGLSLKDHPYHKIYTLRKQIYDRCHKQKHKNYPSYGGRGIYMYNGWKPAPGCKGRKSLFNFLEWCLSNGWEEGLHLDRIDNDGPYAPWNCQFIPSIENIFYSSIDNADERVLRRYHGYYISWECAFEHLPNDEIEKQFFLGLLRRWKNRTERRAATLGILL